MATRICNPSTSEWVECESSDWKTLNEIGQLYGVDLRDSKTPGDACDVIQRAQAGNETPNPCNTEQKPRKTSTKRAISAGQMHDKPLGPESQSDPQQEHHRRTRERQEIYHYPAEMARVAMPSSILADPDAMLTLMGHMLSFKWSSDSDLKVIRRLAAAHLPQAKEFGTHNVVSLSTLRPPSVPRQGVSKLRVKLVHRMDIGEYMVRQRFRRSVIQVASQANGLEMSTPDKVPSMGLEPYLYDKTQGPAVALATIFDTFFRNVFLHTFNGLHRLGIPARTNGKHDENYVQNGYIRAGNPEELLQKLTQMHNEVEFMTVIEARVTGTSTEAGYKLSTHEHRHHLFNSYAIPIGVYGNQNNQAIKRAADRLQLINFEAVLLFAEKVRRPGKRQTVVLTQLGEGVFNAPKGSSSKAILTAIKKYKHLPLDVVVNVWSRDEGIRQLMTIAEHYRE